MKLESFKKLIREIVREEVQGIIREELHQFGKYLSSQKTSTSNTPKKSLQTFMDVPAKEDNSIEALIQETAQNMNKDEYRSIINAGSHMAQGFSPSIPSTPSFYSNNNPIEANIENIETGVPDFRALMGVMKEKNMI